MMNYLCFLLPQIVVATKPQPDISISTNQNSILLSLPVLGLSQSPRGTVVVFVVVVVPVVAVVIVGTVVVVDVVGSVVVVVVEVVVVVADQQEPLLLLYRQSVSLKIPSQLLTTSLFFADRLISYKYFSTYYLSFTDVFIGTATVI